MTRKQNSLQAFSLLELSLVMIIISLLTIGVMKGASMIRSSAINNARLITVKSEVQKLNGLIAWYEGSMSESVSYNISSNVKQLVFWQDISPDSLKLMRNKLTPLSISSSIYHTDFIKTNIQAVGFDGTKSLKLDNLSQGSSSKSTIFLVFQPAYAPSSNVQILFDDSKSGSAGNSIGIKQDKVSLNGVDSATSQISNIFTASKGYILSAYFNGSNSRAYINSLTGKIGGLDISLSSSSLSGIMVGADRAGANAFSGQIAEAIVFNRILSDQERMAVLDYLSTKYSIMIDKSCPSGQRLMIASCQG